MAILSAFPLLSCLWFLKWLYRETLISVWVVTKIKIALIKSLLGETQKLHFCKENSKVKIICILNGGVFRHQLRQVIVQILWKYFSMLYSLVSFFINKLPVVNIFMSATFLHKVGGWKKVDPTTNGWSVFSHENDRLSMID